MQTNAIYSHNTIYLRAINRSILLDVVCSVNVFLTDVANRTIEKNIYLNYNVLIHYSFFKFKQWMQGQQDYSLPFTFSFCRLVIILYFCCKHIMLPDKWVLESSFIRRMFIEDINNIICFHHTSFYSIHVVKCKHFHWN